MGWNAHRLEKTIRYEHPAYPRRTPWDIATSVGSTAVMVAAAARRETDRSDALIRDPYARILVDGAGTRHVGEHARRVYGRPGGRGRSGGRRDLRHMNNYQAVRTHFFDAYFAGASRGHPPDRHPGVRSGLARLNRWTGPAGTHVYEIDQPRCWSTRPRPWPPQGPVPPRHCTKCDRSAPGWPAALEDTASTRPNPPPGSPKAC